MPLSALLQAGVVVDADGGPRGYLLPAQARRPPFPLERLVRGWWHGRATGAEELSQPVRWHRTHAMGPHPGGCGRPFDPGCRTPRRRPSWPNLPGRGHAGDIAESVAGQEGRESWVD